MAEENQLYPLAPAGVPRSDEEFATLKPVHFRHQRSSKWPVYILAGVVFQSAIMLVFALIVLRINTPNVKLRSIAIKNLSYSNESLPSFNVTMIAEVTVKNENFGHFKFGNSTAIVLYRNMTVGDAKIVMGRAKARETKRMNVTVKMNSNGFPDNKNLSSDINLGMLELRSYAKLRGKVTLMNIIKARRTMEMNCSMTLNLMLRTIQDLQCL